MAACRKTGEKIVSLVNPVGAENKQGGQMQLDVTKVMAKATETMTDGAFQQAGSALNDAINIVREEVQRKTSSEIQNIIGKLRSGYEISGEEITLVKTWIIGDAIGYTTKENNLQDWISEYERLQESLKGYENRFCSSEELLMLHGMLEDASRISYDIANFLEKQDRINKFESAVSDGLDKGERDLLVNLLTVRLQSFDY
ncbi:MAG: hypothetical protein HGB20_06450 [Chlorobiaceae bacterium]|nr:hypothetical protein [Chlorobiaceae bacterium]